MSVEAITRMIQLILAPVVLVSACAIFVGGLLSHYEAINARMRSMARERLELVRSFDWRRSIRERARLGARRPLAVLEGADRHAIYQACSPLSDHYSRWFIGRMDPHVGDLARHSGDSESTPRQTWWRPPAAGHRSIKWWQTSRTLPRKSPAAPSWWTRTIPSRG